MTADSSGPTRARKWAWLRWAAAIALVFAAHVILIFIFGARKPVAPVVVRHAPSLALVNESPGDWLPLNNATLFALPGNNGFAASMWAQLPPMPIHPPHWTEEPRWLNPSNSLQMAGLFASFNRFANTNRFVRVHFEYNVPPAVAAPATPTQPPMAQQSTLRIEGALAGRRLLNSIQLPSWPDSDIDGPTIVQVLVNAAGDVVSAVLLPQALLSQGNSWEPPLTDNQHADQWAVTMSRSLRFAPLPDGDAGQPDISGGQSGENSVAPSRLAIGRLIFNWRTIPQSGTNTNGSSF
jgi:hypothetical protein